MLRKMLKELGVDCLIVTSGSNTMYYSGYANPECTLVATEDSVVYYTDDRYTAEAKQRIPATFAIVSCRNTDYARICKPLAEKGVRRVALELGYLTQADYAEIVSQLNGAEIVDCTDALCRGRMLKLDWELDSIRRAAKANDVAFENLLGQVREGMTELEMAYLLQYEYIKAGGEGIAFDTIAVFGDHTAYPHGHPGHRKLKKGDVVTLDFGTKVNGYCSDITRSFAFGDPGDEYKTVYNHVLTANLMGIAAGYDGVSGQELDKIARDYLNSVGLGKYFGHSLGHGVGIDIHEKPFVSSKSKDLVRKGSVYTIEPGVYIEGSFGVRIEDLLYMDDSPVLLSHCNKNLIIL